MQENIQSSKNKNVPSCNQKFILIYGLPGCGKTTLCTELINRLPNLIYLRLDKFDDFKQTPVPDIIKREISKYLTNTVITDGCFPNYKFRQDIYNSVPKSFTPISIFLNESTKILSTRRNRTEQEYNELLLKYRFPEKEKINFVINESDLETRIKLVTMIINSLIM